VCLLCTLLSKSAGVVVVLFCYMDIDVIFNVMDLWILLNFVNGRFRDVGRDSINAVMG